MQVRALEGGTSGCAKEDCCELLSLQALLTTHQLSVLNGLSTVATLPLSAAAWRCRCGAWRGRFGA